MLAVGVLLVIINPYIEMYNHSYSHANNRYKSFYIDPEKVLADFEKNQADFAIPYKIVCLPGRNLWQVGENKKNYNQTGATSADLLAKNGYKVFGWDVEWRYNPKDYTPEQTIDELVAEIKDLFDGPSAMFISNHVVLLRHVQMFATINEQNDLGLLIRKLKEGNFEFKCLSDYPCT